MPKIRRNIMWQTARAMLQFLVDGLFPPRCPSCQLAVDAHGNFCAPCFSQLRMIHDPLCHGCGTPFVVALPGEGNWRCPTCLETPPVYEAARAALVYDAVSAPLVSALKFNDQWAHIGRYVAMMHRAGAPLFPGTDFLVPVPLHWRRLWRRRFNQSALLAFGLATETGITCLPDMLRRERYTRPQMRLKREERLKNVRHAFMLHDKYAALVQGKVILLVDDVRTTGATVDACARALKKAGAKEVRVLTLACTIRE